MATYWQWWCRDVTLAEDGVWQIFHGQWLEIKVDSLYENLEISIAYAARALQNFICPL